MKLTIIRDDNCVYIDGISRIIDCSSLDPSIHAIQWNGQKGMIEYVDPDPFDGKMPAPKPITDITPYQYLIDAWNTAAVAEAAANTITANT
ncbi:hypothetical protein EB001_15555 [bacterium]|nr:hypothetical protein [bacterium]